MAYPPKALGLILTVAAVLGTAAGQAEPPAKRPAAPLAEPPVAVADFDGTVVRWYSRPTGGVEKPQFIFARELAFEARLEALKDGLPPRAGYGDKHVQLALQHAIAETMLANLPVEPAPTFKEVSQYAEEAKRRIYDQICAKRQKCDGQALFDAAWQAEGLSWEERDALMQRRARASWYLHKMVAPMLKPSEPDLREVHQAGESPFTDQRFEQIKDELESWYVATRLESALDRYYRNARSRIVVRYLSH